MRRLTTATGAITAGSIVLTGAFMALAKQETDERNALRAQREAADEVARQAQQQLVAADSARSATDGEPTVHVYTSTAKPAAGKPTPPATARRTTKPPAAARTTAANTDESAADTTARPTTRTSTSKSTPKKSTTTRKSDPPPDPAKAQEPDPPKPADPPPVDSSGS